MKQKNTQTYDDYVTNKILIVFTSAFVGLLALMAFDRNVSYGLNVSLIYRTILPLICIISALIFIGGAVLVYTRRKHKKNEQHILLSGKNIMCIAGCCLAAVIYLLNFDYAEAIKVLYVLIPSVSLLYLIFYIYQKEFFFHAAVGCFSAGSLWLLKKGLERGSLTKAWILLILFAVVMTLLFVFTAVLKNKKGVLEVLNKEFTLFPEKTNYILMFITCAVAVILFLAAFIIRSALIAYYFAFAVLAYVLVLAIYYTTKLI